MTFRPLLTACAAAWLGGPAAASAQTTLSTTEPYFYAANAGWVNVRPSAADGLRIGQFFCDGSAWAANVGWISFGTGAPANGWSYANNTPTDWGVNVEYLAPGIANLRGQAYGANIGWITFESLGGARIDLLNGRFAGHAWSANLGWISLGDITVAPRTLAFDPGPDTNGNNVPDAWERRWFNNLFTVGANTDFDKDGETDREEYLAGTNPLTRFQRLDITALSSVVSAGTRQTTITFNSVVDRVYRIETTTDLAVPGIAWADAGLGIFAPDAGSSTTRTVSQPNGSKRFYRIVAVLPLTP